MSFGRKALIPILLFVVCLIYFHDILTSKLLFTERDLSIFFLPPRICWVDMIKGAQIPLWNPYYYCGQPLLATLQPGVLYPLNLLLILLPFDLGFNLIIIIHYFLAGTFTYFFIKTVKGTNTGALIGSIIFMLSGYLLSVHNLLPHLLSVVWLPLILLCYQNYLIKGSLKALIFTSVCLTMMFLGGAIEILYGTFIVIFILLFFPDPFGVGITPLPMKKRVFSFGLVLLLFLLLSAVQLVPFLELAFKSIRAGGLSYQEAITWSLDFEDLLQFFLPDPYGYGYSMEKYWSNQSWLKTIYLGIIPFALSIFFIIEKRRKALPFLLLLLISLMLSFGGNTPIYKLLYNYVPFLNTIRYPVKFLFIFTFLVSIIAGMGYDSLSRQIIDRNWEARRIVRAFLAFSVLAAFIWGILNFFEVPIQEFLQANGFAPPDYNYPHINLHNMKRFLLFCLLFGPVLVFGWRYPRRRIIFSLALLSLLTLDLFFANKGYYQKYDAKTFHEPSESINFLKKDTSLFRIFTTPKTEKESMKYSDIFSDQIKVTKEKVSPGLNMEHGLYSVDGAEVIRLGDFEKIMSLLKSSPEPDSTNLLSLLNVKYLISKFEIDSREFELVKIIGDKDVPDGFLRIYKNLNVLPRAFLVEDYKVMNSEIEYMEILGSKDFDPRNLVLLDKDPNCFSDQSKISDQSIQSHDHEKDKVIITTYQANRIELSVSLNKPKLLFMSETYYPGWEVYIDGNKDTIYRANYAFRGVTLKPGKHKMEFLYRPLSFIWGGVITLLAIIGTGFIFIKGGCRKWKK
ncbi:MAG: YfhO family protein [Proteobacteria bacterium]|nr:YfhO family protein [Pseudomonadota bacterium]MBU4012874.1 YfhO family protein [Pseudomonadota bacterium]MBU4068676.1 YfhO family protein [Pseudomonadota bacterium]MBU4101368.1 YfhO family protein [Pseudomonadota bacterium]MBU4126939.1 YfhO family protein [Pseudomonadota bacterium]